MRAERINETDVLAQLRGEGIRDMREVHLAVVETDGTVSVLKHRWAEPSQKADVLKDEERDRQLVIGKEDQPPPEKVTDSAKALHAA